MERSNMLYPALRSSTSTTQQRRGSSASVSNTLPSNVVAAAYAVSPISDTTSYHMERQHRQQVRRSNNKYLTIYDLRLLSFLTLSIILLLVSSLPGATAAPTQPEARNVLSVEQRQATILFDSREPPVPRMRNAKRHFVEVDVPSIISDASSTVSRSAEKLKSSSEDLISDTTQQPTTSLPSPFDTTLGNNFTSPSCPAFFESFLTNSSFSACLPLSLLLQTSSGFFQAERSPSTLSATLDATCNVNVTKCASLMSSLATQITDNSNCGTDYTAQNPTVLQAYSGFMAYEPLYHAGCLKDTSSSSSSSSNSSDSSYCFVQAATNASSPTSQYIYYLALGVSLPSTFKPTCSTCMQETMAIFAMDAGDSSQPIATDYGSAAEAIDSSCGTNFVNTTIRATSAASRGMVGGAGGALPVVVAVAAAMAVSWLF